MSSGDSGAFSPLYTALRRAGRDQGAQDLVWGDMRRNGWVLWPMSLGSFQRSAWDYAGLHGTSEARAEVRLDFAFADHCRNTMEPFAVNFLGWEDPDGRTDEHFNDGPYLVELEDPQDDYLLNRMLNDANMPPGEGAFIPIWYVSLLDPWRGVQQQAHERRSGKGRFWVDGPVIEEVDPGAWQKDCSGHFCHGDAVASFQRLLRAASRWR